MPSYLKITTVISLLIFNACSSNKKMISQKNIQSNLSSTVSVFDKQGHRGCRGLMPENTIPAMLKALDLGVTTLEMDASISKDKKIFLSHEPFFNHEITTKPNGSFIEQKDEHSYNMYQMLYDSIKT